MSLGHHCVFGAQSFCRKNFSSDVTFNHLYIYHLKNEKEKRDFSGELRIAILFSTTRFSSVFSWEDLLISFLHHSANT